MSNTADLKTIVELGTLAAGVAALAGLVYLLQTTQDSGPEKGFGAKEGREGEKKKKIELITNHLRVRAEMHPFRTIRL